MAWCADHDCPTSMCDEYDHSVPPPMRSVGGHQTGGKTEYTWQRVAMAAKQSGMAVLMVTRHGAFQVKYIPDKPQPECGVPVAPPRPFLKPAKRQWWRPSTWRSK